MQFALVSVLFAVGALAKNGRGFPDGPDCVSLGKGSDGLEVFRDNDGCCLLPARCGNEVAPDGLPINRKRTQKNYKV
ncbi:hypothetical protein H9Q72_012805 [Fusarium xylarioides]|uniref:Uncharacterized protein n=1 Tax=Fusarium xylarioides TaxID=221167 RepID=A0A9P7HG64_9HYPO|nr:hypothetical protein H9Q70_005522 [Fusarium xylarioides]KAG5759061.1 hypothetical protein H9Q72_012805 [Fusarium xylarioides]KAG5783463.1 hypothetical protein H9Q73_002881 [Fusarium xylarioides]